MLPIGNCPCRNQSHPRSGSTCGSESAARAQHRSAQIWGCPGQHIRAQGDRSPHPGMSFPPLFPPRVGGEKGSSVGPHFLSFAWPALLQPAPSRGSKAHSAAPTAPSQWLAGILVPCPGCAAPGHAFRCGNPPNLGEINECWCPWEPRTPAVDGTWAPGWPWPSLPPLRCPL